jgi:hypothetical protein
VQITFVSKSVSEAYRSLKSDLDASASWLESYTYSKWNPNFPRVSRHMQVNARDLFRSIRERHPHGIIRCIVFSENAGTPYKSLFHHGRNAMIHDLKEARHAPPTCKQLNPDLSLISHLLRSLPNLQARKQSNTRSSICHEAPIHVPCYPLRHRFGHHH